MIKKFLLLFILPFNLYFAQQKDHTKEIDTLIDLADKNINVDFENTLIFATKALEKAKKENDSKRIAKAYYYIARSNIFFRRFDQSSKYLEKGLQESAVKNDILLKASFLTLQGSYYSSMSLFEQSLKSYQNAFKLINSNKDIESKLLIADLYIRFADHYTDKNDHASAHRYADKSINAIEMIPNQRYLSAQKIYREKPLIYFYKSWILLEEKKPHEALPFIEKAYSNALFEKYDYMALFDEIYGDYYYQTQSYSKAIDFYLKVVENKKKFQHNHANVDTKIAASYKAMGDRKNMLVHMERADNRRKIDRQEDLAIVQGELSKIVLKEKIEKENLERDHNIIIIGIILFCISVLVVIFFKYHRIKKRRRETFLQQESRLLENKIAIKEREEEIERLRHKVNDSTSELIELVRTNSPLFWPKFQDAYPDFTQKMLKINPALKSTELCFFAHIYMGFSNKEIAEYTFKALKTIENNRSNLRKRISLNSDEDFTVWIRNYINEA